jgi:hypothetical protein
MKGDRKGKRAKQFKDMKVLRQMFPNSFEKFMDRKGDSNAQSHRNCPKELVRLLAN